jgi:fibronectin-binding autotransporter adhesin
VARSRSYGTRYAGSVTGAMLLDQGVLLNSGTVFIGAALKSPHADDPMGSGATLSVSGGLTNTGAIIVAAGLYNGGGHLQIDATGWLLNAGTLTLVRAAGGRDDSSTLTDAGVLTNDGVVAIGGGNLTNPASGTALIVTGAVNNNSTIDVYGCLGGGFYHFYGSYTSGVGILDVSGSLDNSGVIRLSDGNSQSYSYPGSVGHLIDSGVMTNTGTIDAAAGDFSFAAPMTGGLIQVSGTLNNPGHIVLASGNGDGAQLVDSGVVTNNGSILLQGGAGSTLYSGTKDQSATLTIAGDLKNLAIVNLDASSVLSIDSAGYLANASLLTVAGDQGEVDDFLNSHGTGGTLSDAGVMMNSGTLMLAGGLNGYIPGRTFGGAGAQMLVAGSLTNTGTMSLGGGSSFQPDYSPYFIFAAGATLALTGMLLNSGTISLATGAVGINERDDGGGAYLSDSGLLTNTGKITVTAGPGITNATLIIGNTGSLSDLGTIMGSGTLTNAGVIGSGGAGVTSGAITLTALTNDGTIEVAPGGGFYISSMIGANSGQNGVLDLMANSRLTLTGTVSNREQADFVGINSTLALGDASDFAGIIAGLQPQTTIDFLNMDVTSATPVGTMLDIGLADGGSFDLALAAPLGSDISLNLVSDGHQGTDLNFGHG